MYSRNIVFPERTANIRSPRQTEMRSPQGIPVKSFTDRSAYEHFDSMGNSDNAQVSTVAEVVPKAVDADLTESKSVYEYEEQTPTVNSDAKEVIEPLHEVKKENELSFTDLFDKFKGLLDSDIILPVCAILLFLLGDKEQGDILTPIALIAVMIL